MAGIATPQLVRNTYKFARWTARSHCFSPMAGIATPPTLARSSARSLSHCFSPMAGIATATLPPNWSASHCFSPMAGIATVQARSVVTRGESHIVSAQWQALLQLHRVARRERFQVTLFQPNGRHCYICQVCGERSPLSCHIVSAQWQALLLHRHFFAAIGDYVTLFQPNGRHCYIHDYEACFDPRYAATWLAAPHVARSHCFSPMAGIATILSI